MFNRQERSDRTHIPIGGTLVVAVVDEVDREKIASVWDQYLADISVARRPSDSALFGVLDGAGVAVVFHDFLSNEDGVGSEIERSVEKWFGANTALSVTNYERVFVANEARPFSEASRFVFLAKATVDSSLNHGEFNHWYDTMHVPDVASVGLRRAQRFRVSGGGDMYLAAYEIASPGVLESPELAKVRGFHQFTPNIRLLERTVGELIVDRGEKGRDTATSVQLSS